MICQEYYFLFNNENVFNTFVFSRAFLRLLQEVEKLKKQMSANSTRLPLNIECFMEERDVSGDLQRTQMEQICADTFNRVERTLRAILHNASKLIYLY